MKLNDEQRLVLKQLVDFAMTGTVRTEWATVSGMGGVGKTTVLSEFAKLFPRDTICVCAVSHKAKKVIASKIVSDNVHALSVAGLLGMKLNIQTGEFTDEAWRRKPPPIESFSIIIVDECSMIPSEVLEKLIFKKLPNAILIFAGDEGQIRPIRKRSKPFDISPTFDTPNLFKLFTRVRQGEGHPILLASDEYWKMTKNPLPVLTRLQRPNVVNTMGGIYFTKEIRDVIKLTLPMFKQAINEQNTDLIKIVTYTNTIRIKINKAVRQYLFNTDDDFVIGDLMIMQDNFRVPQTEDDFGFLDEGEEEEIDLGYTEIDNSEEFILTGFEESSMFIEGIRFKTYNLSGNVDEFTQVRIPVLFPSEQGRYKGFLSNLYDEADILKGIERSRAFDKYERAKQAVAQADHAYAITAHKAQGSTYRVVIVNQQDMLKAPIHGQEVASLIYTAMTRASHECYMVNKSFTNTLPKQVEVDEEI